MKTKLLFPLNCFDGNGGTQASLKLIIGNLCDKYDCIIILPDGVISFFDASLPITIDYTSGLSKWTFSFRNPIEFIRTVIKLRIALYKHSGNDTVAFLNEPLSAIIVGLFRIRYCKVLYFSRARFYKKSIGIALKYFAQNFTSYVGVSRDQCNILRDILKVPAYKIIEIPDPVHMTTKVSFKKRTTSKVVLGIVGQVDSNKNQLLFVKIIKSLREQGVNAFGEIWGAAPFVDYLERVKDVIKNNGLENNICFKGFSPSHSELYQNLDIVISTSSSEGFGRSLVEGMSYGKIVVANIYAGGPLSIIEDGIDGILFEPQKVSNLVGRLQEIIEDENIYMDMQKKAFFKSRSFSAQNVCTKIVALIDAKEDNN